MKKLNRLVNRLLRPLGFQITRYRKNNDVLSNCLSMLQKERPIKTVFDVGANVGQTVEQFRKLIPDATIYSFEPSKLAFQILSQKADKYVKVFQIALGEYDGTSTLFENSSSVTNSLLPNSDVITKYTPAAICEAIGQAEVKLVRLDTFCQTENISDIDILKIDAQGYERFILEGVGELLNPKSVRTILIEVLFVSLYENQTWFDEIMAKLRVHGYRLFGFSEISKSKETGWRWANAIFVADDDD